MQRSLTIPESTQPDLTEEQERKQRLDEKAYLYGQGHFLFFYRELTCDKSKVTLLDFIEQYDLSGLQKAFRFAKNAQYHKKLWLYTPPNVMDFESLVDSPKLPNLTVVKSKNASIDVKDKWMQHGLNRISNGKVAVIIMAGGQGTRLGTSEVPKGCLPAGPLSNKSLFQLYVERMLKAMSLAESVSTSGTANPAHLYIMTSEYTDRHIQESFQENSNFGMPKENVHFFKQGLMPAVDVNGMMLLETKSTPVMVPNGNGDVFEAVVNSGMHSDMKLKNIDSVHVISVDNLLATPLDPTFLGFADLCGAEVVSKGVERSNPTESVGVMCIKQQKTPAPGTVPTHLLKKDPIVGVVEYSDIPDDIARCHVNPDDAESPLKFSTANICHHYFKLDFMRRIGTSKCLREKYHLAWKKIPCLEVEMVEDTTYRAIEYIKDPPVANGYKMELFIFDSFEFAKSCVVLEVLREEEFAPVKNANGIDSLESAQAMLSNLHRRWLEENKAVIKHTGDISKDIVEVSPLVSLKGEGLSDRVSPVEDIILPFHLEK